MKVEQVNAQVVGILERAKMVIQANMAEKGINASGRTSQSLRVETYADGVRLVIGGKDTAPLATLEVGRDGGKVPRGFTDIIDQWSRDKGLTFGSERERRTFAYLTARKIAREGTERHKDNIDVYSTIVETAARELVTTMTPVIVREINRQVHEHLINQG